MIYMITEDGKRKSNHFIGPIRTWRVKLLYNVPLSHHQNSSKQWLDTVYDDALQHPIVELAGLNRLQYIAEILYEYNTLYGANDDSSFEKLAHRKSTYDWILGLKPLGQLSSLDRSVKDEGVARELNLGLNVKYSEQFYNL